VSFSTGTSVVVNHNHVESPASVRGLSHLDNV